MCTLKTYDIHQILKLKIRITKCKNPYNLKRMRKPKSHFLFSRTSLPSVSTYFSWFSWFLNLFSFFPGFLSLLLFRLSMLIPDFGAIFPDYLTWPLPLFTLYFKSMVIWCTSQISITMPRLFVLRLKTST